MPSIGHLQRLWRSSGSALGVGTGPVPADDLHARVGTQPRREGLGGPIAEYLDRAAGLHIYQDRSVMLPATQGEVVDASTCGTEYSGSDNARIWRNNVIRLTVAASCRVSRAPARPPSASATAHNARCKISVRRACLAASRGIGSAKVVLPQSKLSQNSLRTRSSIRTSRPVIEVSDNRR